MSIFTKIAHQIAARNRSKKFLFFMDNFRPQRTDTVIDVGANSTEYSAVDNYLEKKYPYPTNITVVTQEQPEKLQTMYPKTTIVQGDGTRLPFENNSFSIGYSNAVLEHVGSREHQQAFLRELYRVSHRGYLTTPNRFFPIEIHTYVPLLHLILSKSHFDAFLRFIGKDWATGDYMHLLTKKDLVKLLNEADIKNYRIISNRFLGFTMTFTIIWYKN